MLTRALLWFRALVSLILIAVLYSDLLIWWHLLLLECGRLSSRWQHAAVQAGRALLNAYRGSLPTGKITCCLWRVFVRSLIQIPIYSPTAKHCISTPRNPSWGWSKMWSPPSVFLVVFFLLLFFLKTNVWETKRFLGSRDKLGRASWYRYAERFLHLEFQPCTCSSGHHFSQQKKTAPRFIPTSSELLTMKDGAIEQYTNIYNNVPLPTDITSSSRRAQHIPRNL